MSEDTGLGAVLVSVIAIPLGLWSLFWGFTMAILGGFSGLVPVVAGLVAIVAGLGFFVAAYGVFSGQPWAANVGLAVFGFDVLRRVATFATGDVTFFVVSALFTLASVGGLAYLALNREAFAADSSPTPYGAD